MLPRFSFSFPILACLPFPRERTPFFGPHPCMWFAPTLLVFRCQRAQSHFSLIWPTPSLKTEWFLSSTAKWRFFPKYSLRLVWELFGPAPTSFLFFSSRVGSFLRLLYSQFATPHQGLSPDSFPPWVLVVTPAVPRALSGRPLPAAFCFGGGQPSYGIHSWPWLLTRRSSARAL